MMSPLVTLNKMTCVIRSSALTSVALVAGESGRLHHLATSILDRTRGLVPWNQRRDREYVVWSGLRWMRFAHEDVRHQFVIASAVTHLARLQCNIRWQHEILQRLRQFWAL